MREFNKLFIIALPRCATVSLCDAFGTLGIRTAHLGRIYGETSEEHNNPQRLIRIYEQIRNGDFQLDILKQCSGLADYPACSFQIIQQLDAAYPGSLFVNVRRDHHVNRWLQSVERQFVGLQLVKMGQQASELEQRFMRVMLWFREMTFGQAEFDAGVYADAYTTYQENIEAHFRHRPSDLLTISDIADLEENGFAQICRFLDCDLPGVPFPCSNNHSARPYQAFMLALEEGRIQSQTGLKPVVCGD